MQSLPSLKESRAAKTDAIRAIVAKATLESRDLTDAEQDAFDAGRSDVERLERDISNAEFLANAERRMEGQPVGSGDNRFETALQDFSLRKAILLGVPNHNEDCGRERELSAEIARRSGRTFQGIAVPLQVFRKRIERRVTTTALPAGGPGSNIIGTDYRGDLYIDRLMSRLVVRRLGATVLSNLVGNVEIPKLKTSATVGWVAENSALTPSDQEHVQVTLAPKHAGGIVEFSRNMLLQSSPDIESLIRRDFASVLARAVDGAALIGGGTAEPVGVVASDVDDSVSFATPSWANVLSLIGMVEDADAEGASSAFVMNGATRRKLRSTVKVATTDSQMIMEGRDSLADYPVAVTSLIPSTGGPPVDTSTIIFGNWSDLLLGIWSELDILVNPFESTAFTKGNIMIRAMSTMDVALRHTESFAYADDFAI